MSLITETGTAAANAESYCSVAFATEYHAARGNGAWAALTNEAMEQMLRRATEAMLALYRERWKGVRATSTQALDWPRLDVVVDTYARAADEVPVEVQKACAILALKAISGDLDPDPTAAVKRKRVGPIDVEYYEPAQAMRLHRAVTDLLRPFLTGGDMNIRLFRA
jgi:hypothetical protein